MSGAICFRNTRVPVAFLFEHLRSGNLAEFYAGYPGVTVEQVDAVLAASESLIIDEVMLKRSA
jgi:uncharacterized protein (DUF433 family)